MNEYSSFVGIDLGDRMSHVVVLGAGGSVVSEFVVKTERESIVSGLERWPGSLLALETGTHSGWVSRALAAAGHEVVVADARKVALIHANVRKCDAVDAMTLARLVRADRSLLSPVHVRSERTQCARVLLNARDALVACRTSLVNCVRGSVKSMGERLPTCSAAAFGKNMKEALPKELEEALLPVVEEIASLTERIKSYDARIESVSESQYSETQLLRTVPGVGPITALAFVLTLEDAERFKDGRQVGAYLGLVPRRDQSGERDPQLSITKAGDAFVRRLLVSCAHYILGPHGPDTALRRWGLEKAGDSKRGKRKAIVAVARKLANVLYTLWVNGMEYQAFPPPPERVKQGALEGAAMEVSTA